MNWDLVFYIFIIVFIPISGAYIVPLLLQYIYRNVSNYSEKLDEAFLNDNTLFDRETKLEFLTGVKSGRWIGILERTLIVILLILNKTDAIVVIVALKGLARYKQMDNKIFAEYYIMGTLISVIYSLITFYAVYYIYFKLVMAV